MAVLWKILGGTIGWAIGGPLGALVGVGLGHHVDRKSGAGKATQGAQNEAQTIFVVGVVALAAKLAKADGTVSREEVTALHQALPQDVRHRKEVADIYNEAKQSAHGYEEYAEQLADYFRHAPHILESIYAVLFSVAIADGTMHRAERRVLDEIADIFGLSDSTVESVEETFRVGPEETRHSDKQDLAILGLPESASNEEVRTTYRKLVRELHPDRLIAQGLPQEFVENATKRLSEINAAHDRIRARRGKD